MQNTRQKKHKTELNSTRKIAQQNAVKITIQKREYNTTKSNTIPHNTTQYNTV